MILRKAWGYCALGLVIWFSRAESASGHGSVVSPASRVYRVFQSNPENPSFELAANAIELDGTHSYYTWMELSRNISEAVEDSLPPGFDYSPWVPNGRLASGGRVSPTGEYQRTYKGLDQVGNWPTSPATAGQPLAVDFYATTPHEPSVWDVWLTKPGWTPDQPLSWPQMQFLERPDVSLVGNHYYFDVTIPTDRVGHHVLWVAWQRDDPVGEVFFSTSDIMIAAAAGLSGDYNGNNRVDAADYTVWRDAMTAGATSLTNDPTPGSVAESDFNYWRSHFGQSLGGGAAVPAAVPEPGGLLLMLVGLWGTLRRGAPRSQSS